MKNYKLILLAFGIAYALLIGSVFAQQAQPQQSEPRYQDTQSDRNQDTAGRTRDTGQDTAAAQSVSNQAVENAMLKAQINQNSETLAMMNARNQFWLQVLQTVMPIVSALGIGIVGWLQVKAARERALMAASINGMKTELVAVTRAASFLEGAQLEAEKHNMGDPKASVVRGQELSKLAQDASTEAHRLAALAAGEKGVSKVPAASQVVVNVETLNLKPGETASAVAEQGGGVDITKDS